MHTQRTAIGARGQVGGRLDADPQGLVGARGHVNGLAERRQRVGPRRGHTGFIGGKHDIHVAHAQHIHGRRGQHGAGRPGQIARGYGQSRQRPLGRNHQLDGLGLVAGEAQLDGLGLAGRRGAGPGDLPSRRRAPQHDVGRGAGHALAVGGLEEVRHVEIGPERKREPWSERAFEDERARARNLIRDLQGAGSGGYLHFRAVQDELSGFPRERHRGRGGNRAACAIVDLKADGIGAAGHRVAEAVDDNRHVGLDGGYRDEPGFSPQRNGCAVQRGTVCVGGEGKRTRAGIAFRGLAGQPPQPDVDFSGGEQGLGQRERGIAVGGGLSGRQPVVSVPGGLNDEPAGRIIGNAHVDAGLGVVAAHHLVPVDKFAATSETPPVGVKGALLPDERPALVA